METKKSKQKLDYNFFYVPDSPQTLTIVNDKKSILGKIYSLASFFWILPNRESWVDSQKQFQNQVGEQLICCENVEQTKKQIKNKETVVIICQQFVLKNNMDFFKEDIISKKITHIICIGLPFPHNSELITFVNETQDVYIEISQNKFSYNKANDFINFIFVSKQKWDSSILVKTMFAMLHQVTNRNQMLQYMGQVAKISCPPSKIGLVNQFVFKNMNPQRTLYTPIGWYTKQSFLYTFVNSILRLCKEPTALFVLQPYFKDLFLAIFQLYYQQRKIKQDENHNYRSFFCYRGAAISEKEVEQFKSNINSVVENLGFLSTSKQLDVAKGFVINILYQIEVEDDRRHRKIDYGYAFVDKYSSKSREQQIIFNPLNTFKIIDVEQITNDFPMYIIRLKYGELARVAACDQSDLSKQQMKYKILGQYRISERMKYNSLGDVLVENDFNLEGSLEFCEKYLEIALKSKSQIQINNGYYKLGKCYQNKAEYGKMIQNYSKMSKFQNNKNENDPHYCDCLSRLGTVYIVARQYEKATDYLFLCMNLTKKIYGPQSENYIVVLTNLSAAYINRGLCQQAQKYLKEVKKIQKEKHGENNQVYLSILNNLGTVYYRFGLYQKSIQNLEKALYLESTSVGENHPRCVKKYYNLALAYFRLDQYSKALPLFQKAEAIQKKYFGQNSQSYLCISKFMGIIYSKLNRYDLSIHYFKKCKIFYQANPTSFILEPDYAEILLNMGKAFIQLEKYDQAVQCLTENLKIGKRMYGQQNCRYINILIFLGNALVGLGQYKMAMKTLGEAQFLQGKHLKCDIWQSSLILYGYGIIYQKTGYFEKALDFYKRSKKIQQNFADQNLDRVYGKTLVQIGHLHMKFHDFQKAVEHFYESLKYKKKIFGENHQEYATILSFIGQAYNNWGQLNNALKWFKPFQTAMKKIFGQSHPKYAESLNSLAMVHENLGQLQLAKELYGRSAVILTKELNQKDPLYQKTLGRLSLVLFNLGSFQQSMETCIKSGDAKLIEKITSIFDKGNKISQVVSQFKSQTVFRLPPIKVILRKINESVANKNYSSAIRQIQWLRRVCGGADHQFHQELNKTENSILNKILSQVNNYYEIADHLEGIGHYEESEHIYSSFILAKYKEVAFAIPEIFSFVEGELYSLKNKYKAKSEAKDTHTEEEAKKYQFCYLDFQF